MRYIQRVHAPKRARARVYLRSEACVARIFWTVSRWPLVSNNAAKSSKSGGAPICPPELLKDNLGGAVTNAYTADVEMTVPFDIGEVKVSKLLVHPIKVRLQRWHRARGS